MQAKSSRIYLCVALITGLASSGLMAAEPAYENKIVLGFGGSLQDGDRAGYQKQFQTKKDGFGGIEELLVNRQVDDKTALRIKGRAMAGLSDYLLDVKLTKDEVGQFVLGYKSFRTFYDGSGGYVPTVTPSIVKIFDEDLAVDRANFWLGATIARPDAPVIKVRYDYITRKGTKDSTSWADNSTGTRYIVPSFYKLDEKRHILNASIEKETDLQAWGLGLRYDEGEYSNGRYERRRAGGALDRRITAKEGQEFDLFQIRGSYGRTINEQMRFTTSVANTRYDTVLTGSRIYGSTYDAAYASTPPYYANHQYRDEGVLSLNYPAGDDLGHSEMRQTIATLNLVYRPMETLRVTPSARFERTVINNKAELEESNFNSGNTVAVLEEFASTSEKDWTIIAFGLDARYTGLRNVAVNFKADWSKSEGGLRELLVAEPGTVTETIDIDRDTNLDRQYAKYAATATWHVMPKLTFAAQGYYKLSQNDFNSPRDNTVSSADRYPAYVTDQDFETKDANIRVMWRPLSNLSTVTRYDYQHSTIENKEVGLGFARSAVRKSHIFSETVTVNPMPRWNVQASVNLVWDSLVTPASAVTGAGKDLVKHSDANYTNLMLTSAYAISDRCDMQVQYGYYQTHDSFVDNSAVTVPYGADSKLQQASVTWKCAIDKRTAVSVKYAYADNSDVPSGGYADYEAHLLYTKLEYRF